jgi:hypothetical protein
MSTWRHEAQLGGSATWDLADDGRSVTLKGTSSGISVFVSSEEVFNTVVRGTFRVTGGDDDLIGFVFGYQSPLAEYGDDPSDWDMTLFDWKRSRQFWSGHVAEEGFGLVRVHGEPIDEALWGRIDSSTSQVLQVHYGDDKGWVRNTEHRFELHYFEDRIKIFVDDALIFDVTGTFLPGRFGFYNYSQPWTVYRVFENAVP